GIEDIHTPPKRRARSASALTASWPHAGADRASRSMPPDPSGGKVCPPSWLLMETHFRRCHEEAPVGRPRTLAADVVPRLRLRKPRTVQVLELERVGAGVRAVALPCLVPYLDRCPGDYRGGSAPDAAHRSDRRSADRARDAGWDGNAHLLGSPA